MTKKSKYNWLVYVAYTHADKTRGEIISRHKTYEAAEKHCKRDATGHWAIKHITDF